MKFSKIDIQNEIDQNSYKRGLSYYNANKVLECAIERDNNKISLSGVVSGSNIIPYNQNIKITEIGKRVNIIGYCDCPVGYNCKHVVAVCLEYTQGYQKVIEEKPPLLDMWLQNLQNSTSKKENIDNNSEQNNNYFLTYRLFSSTSRSKDELQFYKTKILKNGNLSQGTYIDGYKIVNYTSYYNSDFINDIDRDIFKLSSSLFEYSYDYNADYLKIEGTLGYIIIQELLKSSRCYFDTNKNPLVFNQESIKPQFALKLYKGEYSLKSNLIKKSYRIFNTIPALVLDIEKNNISLLDIDIEVYNQLLNAPKIAKKDLTKVFLSIGKTIPNIDIKAPKGINYSTIEITPTPQIHLKYIKDSDSVLKKEYTSFIIDFNYKDNIVKYMPREINKSLFEDNGKVDIIRDLEFEESIKKSIIDFGFDVEIYHEDLIVRLKDENRQSQLNIWREFINTHLPILKESGWIVKYDEDFNLNFEVDSNIIASTEDNNDWFSLSFNIEFDGQSRPIAPLVSSIIEEFDDFANMPELVNIEVDNNHFVEVQTQQLKPIIQTIIELMDKKDKDNSLKISPYDSHLIANMDENIIWKGSKEILELSQKLKDFKQIKKVKPSKSLKATLRDYQQEGLNWLNFLYEFKLSGILADDMGLGKTIQTLAHLSKLKENKKLSKPSLIVMPTSLIANWKNEIKKFTPNLSVLSLHGDDRAKEFSNISKYDILLTTYPLIVRDKEKFDKEKFTYIILDEAQKIKNPKTKMAVAIKTFKCEHRLALSGTPIENHLGELWSIFSFLMPGFFDTLSFFKKYYQLPIEKENNMQRQMILNKRIKPFMIRRTKEIVASELPAKSEIIKYTQFSSKQSKLYESIRITMDKKVREAVSNKGIGSSHIMILDALLKLRQVCCDPSLLKIKEAQKVQESAKLELFLDLIDELVEEGKKILVFSQFTSMLSILEENIKQRDISYTILTGSTKKREEAINKFTKGDARIFLISLKAGGVGLNLVEADTVIHYDPWWNPAVENQATDRAYRIGQTKAVFVYKLIVENSIEQKILELQKKKQAIQDGIYQKDGQQNDIKFSGNELLELLK